MKHFLAGAFVCLLGLGLSNPADGRSPVFLGKGVDRWRRDLSDPDAKARRSAAFALGRIGDDALAAVPDVVKRLRADDDPSVRDMAAAAIGDIARALKGGGRSLWTDSGGALVQALKSDENPRVRRSAAYALGSFGPTAAGAAEALQAALRDGDASVRQNAAWALGQIGEDAGAAVPALCACLGDKDALVRRDAAGAIGAVGKAGVAGVSALIGMVKSEPDEVVKKTALDSLSHLAGPDNARSAEGLVPLLDSSDPEVSIKAAIVLARIGGDVAPRALPGLRKALKDPDPQIRELTTAALANLGPKAEPAMYDLADVLTDAKNPPLVRRNAALAIAHIGAAAKPVVPALVEVLKPAEPLEVRRFAAEALAQMKYPANENAVPAILDAIRRDTDNLVRQKCVWSLFGMKREDVLESGADKVLTKLLDEKADETTLVRYDAARKLASVLGPESPDRTADVLLHMLHNKSLRVYNRTDAKVEGGNEARSGKADVQANTGGDARYMAAQALGWLRGKARVRRDVMDALKKAAEDDDPMLRKTARESLKDINED